GAYDVLINCVVLTEGFDCPELQTVFCRPSCKGVTVQMCGRVLRKHPGLPFKQVVQCRKTRWPFVRTAGAALQYVWVHDEWPSLQANPRINQLTGRMLAALARTPVQLPRYVLQRQESRHRTGRERWPGE